jgi:hypothetical protein
MSSVPLRVTVLDPALDPNAPTWGDAGGGWLSAGEAWMGLLTAAGVPARGIGDPTAIDDAGLLVVGDPDATPESVDRARDESRPVLTGPPPSDPVTALAAVRDSLGALVRPDLRGVLVLRLDDPGAAVRRHLKGWAHADVEPEAWSTLGEGLRGFGRVSIFCCPGWVDASGAISSSRDVNPTEWAALDDAVRTGIADLECHGYTHVHPETTAWAEAPDRHDAPEWYREMWPPREPNEPSVDNQARIIAAWQAACGPGTTLVAPGEAWGLNTIAAARRQGLRLFTSWGLCRLDLAVPTWSVTIASPYLDEADPSWLAPGLPAIGYWHDRDMVVHGPAWVGEQLDAWRDCGATRAWAFSDLLRAYQPVIDAALVDGHVAVRRAPSVPLIVERAGP